MLNIIPAILEADFTEIEAKINSVLHDTNKIHIDICDGLYVPFKTWPYSESKNNRINENFHIKNILNEDFGLPNWQDINYEFDLMIQNPNLNKDIWGRIGAETLIIHPDTFKDNDTMIDFIHEMNDFMIEVIIAVTYDQYFEYEEILHNLFTQKNIKSLQIMTIKTIGLQGQKFDDRCVDLLKKIRLDFDGINLRIDGGVSDKTIDKLLNIPINEYIIGSAIFGSGNARENLNYFKNLC